MPRGRSDQAEQRLDDPAEHAVQPEKEHAQHGCHDHHHHGGHHRFARGGPDNAPTLCADLPDEFAWAYLCQILFPFRSFRRLSAVCAAKRLYFPPKDGLRTRAIFRPVEDG